MSTFDHPAVAKVAVALAEAEEHDAANGATFDALLALTGGKAANVAAPGQDVHP